MGKASRKKQNLTHGDYTREGRISKGDMQKSASKTFPLFILFIIIILVMACAVYFNALSNNFVYDDAFQVLGNRWITDISHIPEIFSKSVWSFQSASSVSNYYRPMMHLIFMINYHLFGLEPWGFHLVNILFHAGISILVFVIASRLFRQSQQIQATGSYLSPFIAALLFATYPIHTEAVAWVAGLPEISFTFFYFLSFYFYIGATKNGVPLKGVYLLSVVSFFLAALCKETALTLPLILVAYDYAYRKEKVQFAFVLNKYVPYLIAAGVYFILRFHALGHFAPNKRHMELSTYQHFINIFPLFMQYLQKLILPINLNAFYVLHPISSLSQARGILSLISISIFVILTFIAFRKNRVIFLGLLFITVPLLPVLYIPGVGENTFAERYLYVPSFGGVLLLASLIEWTRMNRPSAIATLTAVTLMTAGLFSVETLSRNTVWKNDYRLFSDMIKKSPDAKEPHNDLGAILMEAGQIDDAIKEFQIASTLNPDFAEAHSNLGAAFYMKGWTDKAIEQYQIALRLNPDHADARNGLGAAFYKKGWIDKAIEQYQIALRLNPNNADANNNLGLAFLYNKGLVDKAIEHFELAVNLRPTNSDFRKNLEKAGESKMRNAK